MFGDGLFGQWRLKMMSAFTTGLVASTSMLTAGDPQMVIKEIKQEIRNDGLSFSYEAVEEFDAYGLYEKMFAKSTDPELKKAADMMKIWKDISTESGFMDVDGYGSSVSKEGELYDFDGFLHLKKGNDKSLLWKIMGGPAKEFKTLKMAPENTVLSLTFRMDIETLWKFIKEKAPSIKIPDMPADPVQALEMLEQQTAQMGMPIESITKALTTEATLVVTMNKEQKMMLPGAPPLPQMSAALIIEKNGDFLQNYVLGALVGAPTEKVKADGFQQIIVNQPLPTGTKAGVAYNDQFLILTTDTTMCKGLSVAAQGKGLFGSSKFAKYSSLPKSGNMAVYVSPEISNTISEITKGLPPEVGIGVSTWSVMLFEDKTPELFAVIGKKSNGVKMDMYSSFNTSSTKVAVMLGGATIGILAAMILPALGKARMKAKQAKSKSRLKQIGTTVAMYYTDGGSTEYPKDFAKFDFDEFILSNPDDNTPYTLKETMEGKGAYLFLRKAGENYTGSATAPLAMEKPGLWNNGIVHVVFEDGHVGTFFGDTKEEILKQLKEFAQE